MSICVRELSMSTSTKCQHSVDKNCGVVLSPFHRIQQRISISALQSLDNPSTQRESRVVPFRMIKFKKYIKLSSHTSI